MIEDVELVPSQDGCSWEALVTPGVLRMRFGTIHVGLPRDEALRLAHAILTGYGAAFEAGAEQ